MTVLNHVLNSHSGYRLESPICVFLPIWALLHRALICESVENSSCGSFCFCPPCTLTLRETVVFSKTKQRQALSQGWERPWFEFRNIWLTQSWVHLIRATSFDALSTNSSLLQVQRAAASSKLTSQSTLVLATVASVAKCGCPRSIDFQFHFLHQLSVKESVEKIVYKK